MPALLFQKPINSSLSAPRADRLLFYLCFSLLHCTGQPEQCPEQPDGCFFIERSAANSAMPINARIKTVGRFIYRASLYQTKCQTDTADGKGNEPCDHALGQRSRDGSPRAAHLALYGGNCRNTGGVEQHEYQKYDRGKRRK